MPEVRPAEYRLYSRAMNLMLTWVAPTLMTLMGVAFLYSSVIRPLKNGPPVFFAFFFTGFAVFFWFRQLRRPHRIAIRADGEIEFVGPIRRVVVAARDIISIKPDRSQFGFLVIRWGSRKLTLMNQFDGFHELLTYIKSVNPGVEIRGC